MLISNLHCNLQDSGKRVPRKFHKSLATREELSLANCNGETSPFYYHYFNPFYNILTNFLTQFSNCVVVQFDSFSYHNNCGIAQIDRCKNAMAKLLREPPYLLFKTPMHHFGACLFFSWPIPMPENKLTNKFLFFFLISFPGKVNPVIYSNNSRCSESPPL